MALSKSLPTPTTSELLCVVLRVAVGAPLLAYPEPIAPIAPEPYVPVAATPLKVITVIEETTVWDSVAVTDTFFNTAGAKARQISDVPPCTLVLTTSTHVNPAPETLCTVVFGEPRESVEMKANSSSLLLAVENAGELTVELAVFWSCETLTSLVIPVAVPELGFTVMPKVLETLFALAVSVTDCVDVTEFAVAVKPALVVFCATVTLAGTVTAELLLDRFTLNPPLGAALVKETVQ